MPSNVDTLREVYELFNRRDYDASLDQAADDYVLRDHARGLEFRGREEIKAFLSSWVDMMSDARIESPSFIDAGDKVVAQYIGRGTNDGRFGELPPTGKKATLPFCEVVQFDEQGKLLSTDMYYDQLSLLAQLGLVQPRPTVAGEAEQPPAL